MSKEKLEKYRTLGFWLLLLTILSFLPIIQIAFDTIKSIIKAHAFFAGSFGLSLFLFVVDTFILLKFFWVFSLFIFRLFGIYKRNQLWIVISLFAMPAVISLFAMPVVILSAWNNQPNFPVIEFLWSLLNAFVWSFYLYFSKRTNIYFMPENEYFSLLNKKPVEQARLTYMNDSDKFT